jgi:DnaK suppressor protein
MPNLTQSQLQQLQKLLDAREAALEAHLEQEDSEKDDFLQVASEVPDSADSSFATLAIDLDNASAGRDLGALRAIEAARQRMHSGDYGDCIQCGTDIPYERLAVQPTALRCAPCQDNFERTHAETSNRPTM